MHRSTDWGYLGEGEGRGRGWTTPALRLGREDGGNYYYCTTRHAANEDDDTGQAGHIPARICTQQLAFPCIQCRKGRRTRLISATSHAYRYARQGKCVCWCLLGYAVRCGVGAWPLLSIFVIKLEGERAGCHRATQIQTPAAPRFDKKKYFRPRCGPLGFLYTNFVSNCSDHGSGGVCSLKKRCIISYACCYDVRIGCVIEYHVVEEPHPSCDDQQKNRWKVG